MIDNQPKLLTDILNHLASSNEARERFNSISESIHVEIDKNNDLVFVKLNSTYSEYWNDFWRYDTHEKKSIIQTALSNTPDGQPVCELLGKETFTKTSSFYEAIKKLGAVDIGQYATFNQVLYLIFTTALFQGTSFEMALEETNAIYLENI